MAGHIENMKDALDNGDVPQRVTNKMIFHGLQEIWVKINDNTECLDNIAERLDSVEHRVEHLEQWRERNPTLFEYVRNNPRSTVVWLLGVLIFFTLALSFSEPLRSWMAALLP